MIRPQVDFTVASLSQWLLGGVADQQDGDGHEHRVTIAVEAVVAADAGKSVRGAAAVAGKSVRGAAAADDTTGAGAEEPVHVAPAAAISVGQRAPELPVREIQVRNGYTQAD